MSSVMKKFESEYSRLMIRTKFISQLGVFVYLIVALAEVFWLSPFPFWWYGAQYEPELMVTRIGINLVVAVPLLVRFIVVSRRATAPRWLTYGSWFLVLFSLFLYYADAQNYWQPQRFIIYADNPLERFLWGYLSFSSIRFIITAAVALVKIR